MRSLVWSAVAADAALTAVGWWVYAVSFLHETEQHQLTRASRIELEHPGAITWAAGDRSVVCLVLAQDGAARFVGCVRDARR